MWGIHSYNLTNCILGRIGDTKEALELIMTELKDMHYAISFCQEHDDPDLWNDLIQHSLNKPGNTQNFVQFCVLNNLKQFGKSFV